MRFDIPAEPLGQALTDFTRAASQQIIYSEDLVKGQRTAGLHGRYTVPNAIRALLSGTRLKVDMSPSGVLMIEPSPSSTPVADGGPSLERASYHLASADPQAGAQTAAAAGSEAQQPAEAALETIVVTGSTSKRTLLDASVDVTAISTTDLAEKAPRNTVEVLEMIPGIFVEPTAGPVSNNYSVRGLPGGGQQFIRLEEDGMPAIYGGLNDDEVFQYDLSIDHVEGLQGGTSGILTPNAAGASINFISRKLNYDEGGGLASVQATSYGDRRTDFWYSAPLGDGLAYAISGYFDSDPGTRDSSFRYDTWHTKFQLEKQLANGATARFTWKQWDEHDPYYADQPYSFNNGSIGGVPGLGTQFGNIIGPGFANITVPDSCANNECFRTFSLQQGIHEKGSLFRIDANVPINDSLSLFARARYTKTDWDFNGVFAGSGSGNSGLASAVTYLTNNASSPIQSLLQAGMTAFPGTTQFGIRSLTTGQVTPASNVAALNALNGNGLLEQTVLNRALINIRDWGSDFGVKFDSKGNSWTNSLTFGAMLYNTDLHNDQSGVSTVINDVTDQSNIYDIVALNNANQVLGTLSNNGLISYGDWGSGINSYNQNSDSVYLNNEFTWNDRLHIDFGLRYEHFEQSALAGQSSPMNVPAGVGGVGPLLQNPNAFNGTFTSTSGTESPTNYTIGVNYTIAPDLSVYGHFEHSYSTNGVNEQAVGLTLYEAGVRFARYGAVGSVTFFRTLFDNTTFGGGVDPSNPNLNLAFFGNNDTNGVDVDVTYRPELERLQGFSLHVEATYQDSTFNNASTGDVNSIGQSVAAQADAFYDGKTPGRTPNLLYTIQPSFDLPDRRGQLYLRYMYIGRIFADNGDAVALPGYGDVALGAIYNFNEHATLNVSIDNVTNVLGLTEGNPRQGFTQSIVNGYFYGRGIVGTTALAQLTYKF